MKKEVGYLTVREKRKGNKMRAIIIIQKCIGVVLLICAIIAAMYREMDSCVAMMLPAVFLLVADKKVFI